MKKPEKTSLETYFAHGDSWASDQRDSERSSRRTAWIVASGASVIAVCEAFALLALTPLKTVEPLTLLVDRQTGFVQTLRPLKPETIAADTALTQSFLVQYVIAREGFDRATLQADYRKVGLWSAGSARTRYIAEMQASNPRSPLSLYPRSTTVNVRVKSVTSIAGNTAMVRYDTVRQDGDGRELTPQAWVVVIRYIYAKAPLSVSDRYVNPLGFQVVSFRRSQETLVPAETSRSDRTLNVERTPSPSVPFGSPIMPSTPQSSTP